MKFADCHIDTLSYIYDRNMSLVFNKAHVDLERIKKFDDYFAFWAVFIHPKYKEPKKRALDIINYSPYVFPLSIENCSCFEAIGDVKLFYNLGVRMGTLVWNNENKIIMNDKVTDFGIEVIKEMERLSMIIDVSHASEKAFWDICKYTTKPIFASHSNCYSITPHIRNLKDEQIKEIFNRAGFIGANLYKKFSGKSIVLHIEYLLKLGGEDHIGIGSDFDGCDKFAHDISGLEDVCIIKEFLEKEFGDRRAEKILYENLTNIVKSIDKL